MGREYQTQTATCLDKDGRQRMLLRMRNPEDPCSDAGCYRVGSEENGEGIRVPSLGN